MLKVLGCFTQDHDLRLVALAAVICALASFTTIRLLGHARIRAGGARAAWLAVAAVAGGSGIWATHFIAMLAFDPRLPSGYDLPLTALSLLNAIALTGAGLAVATMSGRLSALGGAVTGSGVGVMHFTGMAAYQIPGEISWNPTIVAASLAMGAVFGAASLLAVSHIRKWHGQFAGAALLLVAICSLHFTAMGAVTIAPDPGVVVSPSAIPANWLAAAVALASVLILLAACAALMIDIRDRYREIREGDRMRSLADAAVEGLVICRADVILNANESFANFVGRSAEELSGSRLSAHFATGVAANLVASGAVCAVEAEITLSGGGQGPVEIVIRIIGEAKNGQYAVAVRDLSARKQAEREIAYLAHHDALTGLPNRASFDRRLKEAVALAAAGGERLAVLCLDLDRFKEVNDLFGHHAGDLLLQNFARAIGASLLEGQMAARLGGDEFAVLAPIGSVREAAPIAHDLLRDLNASIGGAAGIGVSASMGVSIFPEDAEDGETLMRHADMALYRAKHEGRGAYRIFEKAMGVAIQDRRELERDLRQAAARNELSLVYQPQTDTASGAVIGFEALMRWTHAERGRVSPAIFVAVAEECGCIAEIGEWSLRAACVEAAMWPAKFSIAVNVSAIQLHAPQFSSLVHQILFETGLPASRLEIEITETALVRDLPRALQTLRNLKALGVRIAMDDFGTGYSSLSNLRAFPFDRIKIDRSFVTAVDRNEQAAAIVRSVLGLGRGLGLPVLAEGVETEEERRFLALENCAGLQGYLVGRPAPIEDYATMIHGLPEATRPEAAGRRPPRRTSRPLDAWRGAGDPATPQAAPAEIFLRPIVG